MSENYERFSFWKNWFSWNIYLDYLFAMVVGSLPFILFQVTKDAPPSPVPGMEPFIDKVWLPTAALLFWGLAIAILIDSFRGDLKVLRNMHCPNCKEVIFRKKGPDRGYGFYATDLACLGCGWKRRVEPGPPPAGFGPGSMLASTMVATAIQEAIEKENEPGDKSDTGDCNEELC